MLRTRPNMMMRTALAVLGFATLVSACSGDDATPSTTGAPEAATSAELDAAVSTAAQALLNSPFLEATIAYFDFDDPDYAYRFDWMDARTNGDQVVVAKDIESDTTVAFVQTGGARYTASVTGGETQPWAAFGPALDPPEGALPLYLVTQMAEGTSLVMAAGSAPPDATITRQAAADGSTVWTLRAPEAGADPAFTSVEWIIDRDGLLWFYRIESARVPIAGFARAAIIGFSIPDNAAPIGPPQLGGPPDLEDYGVPPDLWDPTE